MKNYFEAEEIDDVVLIDMETVEQHEIQPSVEAEKDEMANLENENSKNEDLENSENTENQTQI